MNLLQKFYILKNNIKMNKRFILIIFSIIALVFFITALCVGSSHANLLNAVESLINKDYGNIDFKIIFYIRFPRVLGAFLAGAALSVSGIIIQSVLNNPMAAPNLIGVNAGAGFFVIILMALFPMSAAYLPIAAFVGALMASLIIYFISAVTRAGKVRITLVGVAIGSILTAGINTVKTLFPDSIYDVSGFLIGGLSSADLRSVISGGILIVPTLVLVMFLTRGLDVLSLGKEVASGLGMNVKSKRLMYLVLASILAGGAVSFCGLIGFVGLLIPHIVRRIVGTNHRYLIPTSIFFGGGFLIFADTLSRLAFAPYELPVGIFMSLIGGPFFIFLILKERREME